MASMIRGRSPTPRSASQSQQPRPSVGSVFALPYRMLFAVATMDTITVHDTQQAGPICLFTKLHYDEFTDMSWWVLYIYFFLS
jgi:chromatin assembly factor 1 subunit B